MLTLYYRPTCPYCQRVLGEAEVLGVKFNLKDISADPALADELVTLGGKRQVPYLVEDEHNAAMYESGDIIAYLESLQQTSPTTTEHNGVRIHKSAASCESCE